MSEERSVGASPINRNGRPSKAYRVGRVCRESGCGTKLSIYNKGSYCYQHEIKSTPRTRGRKIA